MVSTLLRSLRGYLLPVAGCALLATVGQVTGCAREVHGTVRAGATHVAPARPVPVGDLLIEPTRFPARYRAVVLDPKDIDRELHEIDGVPAGFTVSPPECAPAAVVPAQRAAVQGVDEETGVSLTVAVMRPSPALRPRVDQLRGCPSFTTSAGGQDGAVWDVAVTLLPPPPVDADDTYAVQQTLRTASEEPDAQTLTLVALIDDVQVVASSRQPATFRDAPDTLDTTALDTLFTDAVLKVRSAIPR